MTDKPANLRDEIAEALMSWAEINNSPQYAAMRRPNTVRQNAYGRADAVLAVLNAAGIRDAARQAAGQPVCACGHPKERHITCCTECPCIYFAKTWPTQAAGEAAAAAPSCTCIHPPEEDAGQLLHASYCTAAGQPDTQQQTEGTVIQAPTPQLSYRLEHRGEGESEWRKGRPGLGVHWTSVDRAKVRQRLAEARAQWPHYEHRMVTITTTVAETVTDEAAR